MLVVSWAPLITTAAAALLNKVPTKGNNSPFLSLPEVKTLQTQETPNLPKAQSPNSMDEEYPWRFTGRLFFRPSFVPTPSLATLPPGIQPLSLFGYTIGGVVSLQYDTSPIGPYLEYVTMGAVVTKRGAIGQWGSKLYVSTKQAERICQEIWDVPAIEADIDFYDDGKVLRVDSPPLDNDNKQKKAATIMATISERKGAIQVGDFFGGKDKPRIRMSGWNKIRSAQNATPRTELDGSETFVEFSKGGPTLPILWTPQMKALWAPFIPFSPSTSSPPDEMLTLHKLRLGAKQLRFHLCGQEASDELGVPFPIGLSVDGLSIEIGLPCGTL